jgi:membrane-associated phospholipid phosphatase
MKKLPATLINNRFFYILCLLFVCFSFVLIILFSKPQSFILLNNYHTTALNIFFVNYTFFGDGIFALGLTVFLFYRKQNKLALLILIAFLSSGLTAQLLKNIIYAPRPRIYFEASQYIYRLDNFGNSGGGNSSFPSGHTTSAFALATILALWLRNKWTGIVLAIAAALVGYSRIYLAQHFPEDVLVGACIGIVFATATFLVFNSSIKLKLPKKLKRDVLVWNDSVPGTALS